MCVKILSTFDKTLPYCFSVEKLLACAVSIILILSNISKVVSDVLKLFSSLPSCVLVVHNSQMKGYLEARGGYCKPFVPFP